MVGNQIVCDDCPGIVWKPVKTGEQIDWASTLRSGSRVSPRFRAPAASIAARPVSRANDHFPAV
jgi:hypothetical protein